MVLKFLQETNQSILTDIQRDLSYINEDINIDSLWMMSVPRLEKELTIVKESISNMKTGVYGSWLHNEDYIRDTLIEEAINISINERHSQMKSEKLIVGATYYTQVTTKNQIIEGHKALFMGSKFTGWMRLRESAPIAKALQLLRHGTDDDFRELYIGMADGIPDALNTVNINHILESSHEALNIMEHYCDNRWEGPWPWEIEAPEKFKYMLELREERNMNIIESMQRSFKQTLREFDEGIMDKYELVASGQEMQKRVDSMITDFGKLSSSGIEIMAQVKASGDAHLVGPMQDALGAPLNDAVDALTTLKAALTKATNTIAGHRHNGMDDDGMDDDMGSPMNAMGDDPMASDDAIDRVDIGGDDSERPIKEV